MKSLDLSQAHPEIYKKILAALEPTEQSRLSKL